MGNWTVRWQFDKATYQPGDQGAVNIWVENTGDTLLFASEVGLQFEFQQRENLYYPKECAEQVAPRTTQWVSSVPFEIAKSISGIVRYRPVYRLSEYSVARNAWEDLGQFWHELRWYVKVLPTPYYKVFVSRGVPPEDRLVGDQIVEIVKEWGFETYTAGIEQIIDRSVLAPEIRQRIMSSDCLIAIATPRYLDALTGMWRTLEWLHGEVGIAYGVSRPVLVIMDQNVRVGGLPEALRDLNITYDPLNIDDFKQRLGAMMPSFREWIASRRRDEFVSGLVRAGLPLLVGGIVGFLIASSRR